MKIFYPIKASAYIFVQSMVNRKLLFRETYSSLLKSWRYRGELINLFVFCQPITVVYCGQLTNESARFLQHSIYKLSSLNVHAPPRIWTSIIFFVSCQPITDLYCGQLTNESAQFLQHSIYELSLVNVHDSRGLEVPSQGGGQ